jgi:hypothetical protein
VAEEQRIQATGIPSETTVGSAGIQIRSALWVTWARIAFKHETMALAARQQALQNRTGLAQALEQEMDAALTGICAAAFALEALSREVSELGAIDQATVDQWWKEPTEHEGKRPAAENVTQEVLSKTFDMRGLVPRLQRELPELFDMRGAAAHYGGSFEPTRPHPAGTHVSVAQDTYSADNCTRMVDLLVGILERCRDMPKPVAREWSKGMRGAIDQLIGGRGQSR